MNIYSLAFYTSYQHSPAYCFPDITWTFKGAWRKNRSMPPNVKLEKDRQLHEFDFFLVHHLLRFAELACVLEEQGVPRQRIIHVCHWALQPGVWRHLYDGVEYVRFLKDLSNSAIVCVSHFMRCQFRFFFECLRAGDSSRRAGAFVSLRSLGTGRAITTTRFDDHLAEQGAADVDLIVIDDVGVETRILRKAEGFLPKRDGAFGARLIFGRRPLLIGPLCRS